MICFVFRPRRRRRGQLVEARLYSGKIRLDGETGEPDTVRLKTTDRQVALKRLHDEVRQRQREAEGLAVPRAEVQALTSPFSGHLEAFLADLRAKGRSKLTVTKYSQVIPRTCEALGWRTLRDVSADSFIRWRANQRPRLHPKTLNDRLGALNALLNWLVRQRLLPVNRLQTVEKAAVIRDVSYRRALEPGEFRRLLEKAPPERAIIYLFAVYTGLRSRELKGLRWSDVDLDSPSPNLLVRASISKTPRTTCLPLRAELAKALRAYRPANWTPEMPVFPSVPRACVMHLDLAEAGIPKLDREGRRVDMHALRHTYCTYLAACGVTPQATKELMRHRDLKTTMSVYTHPELLPLAQGVALLPSFSLNAGDAPKDTQRGTQKSASSGHEQSEAVATSQTSSTSQVIEAVVVGYEKTPGVATGRFAEMERAKRFELSTSTLARWCSTN